MRRRRSLSDEENRLWADVARSVLPLPGRARPAPAKPAAEPPAATEVPSRKVVPIAAVPPPPKAAPPLAPLERRMVRALARGQTRAEGTLDLHGLTQAEAHQRLLGFLRRGQAAGHGLVLVVTGRGRDGQEGRGVLRRMVPLWLGAPDLRGLVLGFQEAGTRQGGAGALYVRLRRLRT
ncbi:Smr/MutS family protein [Enterovirga rhinocerotis]|uniref:DNA-nicking Smr family endonuclease n=1 Tax=Enterovirga rhinocerotis TaxID=1339210 RepID=A0A4R7BPV3_9HYPH|nr:Smr/MutS family protein [Enterovirga rhinocerotis]TDR87173.1 DNA-nicking Smr family endonuclease [Enterovirga rhinocerotis]